MTDIKPSSRILKVTEEELSRIVLDIHDGPVQNMFASLSILARLQAQIERHDIPREELSWGVAQAIGMIEEALNDIRGFLGTFRPPEFHKRSLEGIIEGLTAQHEDWSGQTVHLEVATLPEVISLPTKIAVYRILQEALSNCQRHAEVDEMHVKVWGRDGTIWLQVVDEGRGFDPPPLHGPEGTEQEEHIGLRGMRDRVHLVGGRFHLYSRPGQGTRIMVKIPADV